MDPFTARMLERARARREKLDSKLASTGQEVSHRTPLSEKPSFSPSPSKNSILDKTPITVAKMGSPRRKSTDVTKVASPQRTLSREALKVGSPQRTSSKDAPKPGSPHCTSSTEASKIRSPHRVSTKDTSKSSSPHRTSTDTYKISSPRRTETETSNVSSPRQTTTSNTSKSSPRRGDMTKISAQVKNPSQRTQMIDYDNFSLTRSPMKNKDRRKSDLQLEINIVHSNDLQVEVQVEEREVPLSVYLAEKRQKQLALEAEDQSDSGAETYGHGKEDDETTEEKSLIRQDCKSRLQRLGVLYSDKPQLSSPIHRTEQDFTSATPPLPGCQSNVAESVDKQVSKRKYQRLAALADQINNWEDDTGYHQKSTNSESGPSKQDISVAEIPIEDYKDIAVAREKIAKKQNARDALNTGTYNKKCQQSVGTRVNQSDKNMFSDLEAQGYRRVSSNQSRLVYDFSSNQPDPDRQEPKNKIATPGISSASKMATAVAGVMPNGGNKPVKRPSIKKYKAPTPPSPAPVVSENVNNNTDDEKEVKTVEINGNGNDDCIQTNGCSNIEKENEPIRIHGSPMSNRGSPLAKRFAAKLNNNGDRSSVLSRAAMFENGNESPTKTRDPAEMSLRERKALFEKNKGAVIVPKAAFGMAPSAKSLQADSNKEQTKPQVTLPTKSISNSTITTASSSSNTSKHSSRESLSEVSSLSGGVKGKLAALFKKETTISESTITEKFRKEREKELQMLQNRFQNVKETNIDRVESPILDESDDDEHSEHIGLSEKAPLMAGSVSNISTSSKKPEIMSNNAKSKDAKWKSETALNSSDDLDKLDLVDSVIGQQPLKRRSSQDSPIVLSVLDEVKRIRVIQKKDLNSIETNGISAAAKSDKSGRIYPHLSDIETVTSSAPETDDTDCGGSSLEHSKVSDHAQDHLNKSENWADTSFGRDILQVVSKNQYQMRSKLATHNVTVESSSSINSDIDDGLDEALDCEDGEEADEEGPTPPKMNKNYKSENPAMASHSFSYKAGSKSSHHQTLDTLDERFKSPLKVSQPVHNRTEEKSPKDLVHTVSFYRRLQAQSKQTASPMRVMHYEESEEDAVLSAETSVITVEQRIKDLTNEINKQNTVISQASQALNLCAATVEFSASTEQAEGERLLLLATHRRQACLHEVQRLQVEGAGDAAAAGQATLQLKDISLPLRRDYIRQLNAEGAVGHLVLCLVKCRDRVAATSMVRTDPRESVIKFPDQITLEGLTSDFKVTVEVYSLQASKEVLSHDVKYHITTKKSSSRLLTPKSKVSELRAPRIQSPCGPGAVRSPQFQPHGYAIFAQPQLKRTNFTLNKVPPSSPLSGALGVTLAVRTRAPPPPPHAAFLTAFDDVSGLGAWHRRWCQLRGTHLAYWKYPDDVKRKMPIGQIDLTTAISAKVEPAVRDLCARPHTLLLETSVPLDLEIPDSGSLVYGRREDGTPFRRHLLAADTKQEKEEWLSVLNKALDYVRSQREE